MQTLRDTCDHMQVLARYSNRFQSERNLVLLIQSLPAFVSLSLSQSPPQQLSHAPLFRDSREWQGDGWTDRQAGGQAKAKAKNP